MNRELLCLAWRDMRQVRTCPPLRVLRTGSPQARRHLAACPDCREKLEQAPLAAELGKALAGLPLPCPEPAPPAPGDLRVLRPAGKPEDWFDEDGDYHNPPLVLVLNEPDEEGRVLVAQVFDNEDLRAEGDVPLDDGLWGFAEAWNIYGLPVSALGEHPLYRAGKACAGQVLEESRGVFPPIDVRSPLYHFRVCEVETGSFFSLGLNADAWFDQEEEEPEQPIRNESRVIRFVRIEHGAGNAFRIAEVAEEGRERLEKMLSARPDSLPLAAAEAPVVGDSMADGHPRVRISVEDVSGRQEQRTVEASVYRQGGVSLVTIPCPLPEASVTDLAVTCGEVSLQKVEARWRQRELLEISVVLGGEDCSPNALAVAILVSPPVFPEPGA